MLKCPKCNRTYDNSWTKCLFCETDLIHVSESDLKEETTEYEKFGGSKFAIILYSIFLMITLPIIIFLLYAFYLGAWDVEFFKHGRKQLKEAIVFQEKPKAEGRHKSAALDYSDGR